ncbi:DUF3283 family protein [Salmonella enterica]|nr:DUF3283 family protein [Salmonella enterica]
MGGSGISYNISSLTVEEQERVQLSRHAAWLITMRRNGRITTGQISREIENCSEKHRELFRGELNRYREMKPVKT